MFMSDFTRFAIYYLPPVGGELARFGAGWLGWDLDAARPLQQDPDFAALTDTPRKYGFHATIKPPFRLKPGARPDALVEAAKEFCDRQRPVELAGLSLQSLGAFLALAPVDATPALDALAAACVETLDPFRALPDPAELARRRAIDLSAVEVRNLQRWGYPYVMEAFRFHMTLSSKLDAVERDRLASILADRLPPLPQPFRIDELALVGERQDGRFQTIHRYALCG